MKLLQRVMTLVRADIHELLEGAHDPEKTLNQLVGDLKNQFIQVKTTVAQFMADQYTTEQQIAQLTREGNGTGLHDPDNAVNTSRLIDQLQKEADAQKREVEALILALGQLDMKIAEVVKDRETLLSRYGRSGGNGSHSAAATAARTERLEQLIKLIGG